MQLFPHCPLFVQFFWSYEKKSTVSYSSWNSFVRFHYEMLLITNWCLWTLKNWIYWLLTHFPFINYIPEAYTPGQSRLDPQFYGILYQCWSWSFIKHSESVLLCHTGLWKEVGFLSSTIWTELYLGASKCLFQSLYP